MTTESVENYLKAIYKLQDGDEPVATSEIAERLSVSAPSVSRMMKRLSESEWVDHQPYKGVRLTKKGRRHALRVIRYHRILETYLAQVLGMSWNRVDKEVERLEHVVSEELINRMEEALGFPNVDPHGSPIPDRNGKLPETEESRLLFDLEAGDSGQVTRIADAPPEELAYLEQRGLIPGAKLILNSKEPFGGPICIVVDGKEVHLGPALTQRISVKVDEA